MSQPSVTSAERPLRIAPTRSGFVAKLVELLAAIDRFVTWWGAHRAWPANEPARIDDAPRLRGAGACHRS